MKFGIPEIKTFAEHHEDERVRIMYARLCEARSKNAQWCEALKQVTDERDFLIEHFTKLEELLEDPSGFLDDSDYDNLELAMHNKKFRKQLILNKVRKKLKG